MWHGKEGEEGKEKVKHGKEKVRKGRKKVKHGKEKVRIRKETGEAWKGKGEAWKGKERKHGKERKGNMERKGKETIMVVKTFLTTLIIHIINTITFICKGVGGSRGIGQYFHWTGCGNSDRVRRIANKMRCDVSKSIKLKGGGIFCIY